MAVGSELLRGMVPENNCIYLSTRLTELGYRVARETIIPDETEVIGDEIAMAISRSGLIVITGGLGPTEDDVTRKAVFRALNCTLRLREGVLQNIREKFSSRGREMPSQYRELARLPEDARIYSNPVGAAPGIEIKRRGSTIIMLPGVPAEMRKMFQQEVAPFLEAPGSPAFSRIRLFGLSETEVEDRLRAVTGGETLGKVSIISSTSGIDLYLPPGELEESGMNMVGEIFHSYIYAGGERKMEEVVVELLKQNNAVLTTAESVTGGMLASRIISVPGASDIYHRGSIVYSNRAKMQILGVKEETLKKFGAVSGETCREMARGGRSVTGADYTLATTGIAGPSGGTAEKPVGLCYIGLATEDNIYYNSLVLPGDRNMIRRYVSTAALDMLRLSLLNMGDRLISFKQNS